jgi:hypothetical protein
MEPEAGESGQGAPDRSGSEKASSPRRHASPNRRTPKRSAEKDSAQGSLFEDLTPPPPAQAPSPEASDGAEDQEAGKKSRSKRRRERRKIAKAAEAPRPSATQTPAPQQGSAAPRDRPPPKPRTAKPAHGEKRASSHQREGSPRPRYEERRPYAPAPQQGKARTGPRSSDAYRERRQAEGPSHRRGHIEGLPPMSSEDLAAVARAGYDGDSIPRGVSNVRGHSRAAPTKAPTGVRTLEVLSPSSESLSALAALEGVLGEAVPLQAKHRAALRGDIRRLWEELTSDRESRSVDYLSSPPALSAYLRYFLPWNIFRLTALLANADFCLPDKAVIVDIGSGPLTLPIALWIARPELREVPLTIYCMDRVERVLEAGLNIFQTLCMRVGGRLPPWRIETRKDSFGSPLPERAHLLTAANVFNEFFWKDSKKNLGEKTLDTARSLLSYLRENGSLFVMEPGDPRSGAFITALRAALLAEGAPPHGPSPHALSCPMPGIFRHLLPPQETRTVKGDPNVAPSRYVLPPVVMPKNRDKFPWCHFGVDALKAPKWLEALSEEAGLPKERAVLSYLWAARGATLRPALGLPEPSPSSDRERRARAGRGILVRVISESFALPDGSSGQYACSSLGYTMLKRPRGEEPFGSGDLLEVTSSPLQRNDEKSGAIVLPT